MQSCWWALHAKLKTVKWSVVRRRYSSKKNLPRRRMLRSTRIPLRAHATNHQQNRMCPGAIPIDIWSRILATYCQQCVALLLYCTSSVRRHHRRNCVVVSCVLHLLLSSCSAVDTTVSDKVLQCNTWPHLVVDDGVSHYGPYSWKRAVLQASILLRSWSMDVVALCGVQTMLATGPDDAIICSS